MYNTPLIIVYRELHKKDKASSEYQNPEDPGRQNLPIQRKIAMP